MADDNKSELERVIQESMGRKAQVQKLKKELAEANAKLAEVETLRQERDDLKQKLANRSPNELQARIDELEKGNLVRERTEAFHKLVREAGVADEHAADVERLIGFKPDADDYDPSQHGAGIADLVGRIPSLKDQSARHHPATDRWLALDRGGSRQQGFATPRPPGPASDRGSAPTSAQQFSESRGRSSGRLA